MLSEHCHPAWSDDVLRYLQKVDGYWGRAAKRNIHSMLYIQLCRLHFSRVEALKQTCLAAPYVTGSLT